MQKRCNAMRAKLQANHEHDTRNELDPPSGAERSGGARDKRTAITDKVPGKYEPGYFPRA